MAFVAWVLISGPSLPDDGRAGVREFSQTHSGDDEVMMMMITICDDDAE